MWKESMRVYEYIDKERAEVKRTKALTSTPARAAQLAMEAKAISLGRLDRLLPTLCHRHLLPTLSLIFVKFTPRDTK